MSPQELATLRKTLRPIASALRFRVHDLDAFLDHLEDVRGRPVEVVPRRLGSGVLALWAATEQVDYIVYERDTTAYHQRHLIFHEGSHLLLGHEGPPLEAVLARLVPHLDPGLVRSLRCHARFNDVQEAEAELLATLLEEQRHRGWLPTGPVEAVSQTAHAIARFFQRSR